MHENDGRFPDEIPVDVWYPKSGPGLPARDDWEWMPGTILEQTDFNEWEVRVDVDDLATLDDDGEPLYPVCFRDTSELRQRSGPADQHH